MGGSRVQRLVPLALLSGCSYTSEYQAPRDGRARVLWRDNHLVDNRETLPAMTKACEEAVARRLRGPSPKLQVWAPRFSYFKDVVLLPQDGGIDPLRPPLFAPSLEPLSWSQPDFLRGARLEPRSWWQRHMMDWVTGRVLAYDPVEHPMADGLGRTLLDWVSLSFAALPPLALWPVLNPPGLWTTSSSHVDWAHAYNDLARTPGTPCAYEGL